jgi:hypothetical protein
MTAPLSFVGRGDDVIWPIFTEWHLSVYKELTEKFTSGKFSTRFPDCVEPGYRAQNTVP